MIFSFFPFNFWHGYVSSQPNPYQAPARCNRSIPYLRVLTDRRDSTCSLSVSDPLGDLLARLSSLLGDSRGGLILLSSRFRRGAASAWKRSLRLARMELELFTSGSMAWGLTGGGGAGATLLATGGFILIGRPGGNVRLRSPPGTSGLQPKPMGGAKRLGRPLRASLKWPCSGGAPTKGSLRSGNLLLRGGTMPGLSRGLLWKDEAAEGGGVPFHAGDLYGGGWEWLCWALSMRGLFPSLSTSPRGLRGSCSPDHLHSHQTIQKTLQRQIHGQV